MVTNNKRCVGAKYTMQVSFDRFRQSIIPYADMTVLFKEMNRV